MARIDRLLRRDASEEGEICRLCRGRGQEVCRQTVVDCLHPARLRHRLALHVRDRNDRHGAERIEHRLVLGQVEAAMHRSDERGGLPREHREGQIVEMEVQDIETAREPAHALEHGDVQRHRIAHRVVETQRTRPCRFELCRGARVAAGEQRHVMAEGHKLFREPGNDALGASVQFRWDGLGQRCNLRDSHETPPCCERCVRTRQTPAWTGVREMSVGEC